MQAELHGGVLVGVLKRILFVAGCAIGSAFVAAFALSSGTAHAAGGTGSIEVEPDATTAASTAAASTLWADPVNVSATAVRRASAASAWSLDTGLRAVPAAQSPVSPERTSEPPKSTGQRASTSIAAISAGTGSLAPAGGHGSPDAGPSIAQLACLTAALGVVLWLSQRVLASELAWRSVLITSIAERPG